MTIKMKFRKFYYADYLDVYPDIYNQSIIKVSNEVLI